MAAGIPFDEQAKRRVVAAMQGEKRIPFSVAAERAGFTPSTVKRHMKLDPDFAQAIADAMEVADGEMEEHLHNWIIQQESIAGALKWLERRQPRQWGEQKMVVNQHVGPGGGPIQIAVASTDSLRELLTGDDYREKMLSLVKDIPMIEATASEQ